jgi:hypothetical protein
MTSKGSFSLLPINSSDHEFNFSAAVLGADKANVPAGKCLGMNISPITGASPGRKRPFERQRRDAAEQRGGVKTSNALRLSLRAGATARRR